MKIFKGWKTMSIAYDYYSIMHYSPNQCSYWYTSFGIYRAKYPSMTFPKDFTDASDVGQRTKLTAKDIQHINTVYCSSM